MRVIAVLAIAAFAIFNASCEYIEVPPPGGGGGYPPGGGGRPDPGHGGGGHGGHHPDDSVRLPDLDWELHRSGVRYDLDLIVDRREVHVADGGDYIRGRRVSRSSRDVPAGTVSAFEVELPHGETDLYWVEEGRPGTLLVYTKFYDSQDRRWSRERRLRSISY